MTIPTTTVNCQFNDSEGNPAVGARVVAVLDRYELYQGYVVPLSTESTTDSLGQCSLDLFPNELGSTASSYTIRVFPADGYRVLSLVTVVPDSLTAVNLHDIAELPGFEPGQSASGLPLGGVLNDILVKQSSDSWDADWQDFLTLDAITFDTAAAEASAVGKLKWNDTDGTLDLGLKGGNVTLQMGQEQVLRVLNKTGSTISDGSVVYLSGSQGNRITVALADADAESTADRTIGIATESISNNQEGFVTTFGLVRDIDTSAWTEGSELYVSSTAGQLTSTPPVAPKHSISIGLVTKQHVTQGSIFVRVHVGTHLDELHDTVVTSPVIRDVLQYEGAVWRNNPVRISSTIPATSTSTGVSGTLAMDSTYLYGCTSTNNWKRIAWTTF